LVPERRKSFTDTRRVGDLRAFVGALFPSGRYYVWLVSDLQPMMRKANAG